MNNTPTALFVMSVIMGIIVSVIAVSLFIDDGMYVRDEHNDLRCTIEYGNTWHYNATADKCVNLQGKTRDF